MLALATTLEQRGKQVRLLIASTMPGRYRFLDPEGRIEQFSQPEEEYRKTNAVIVLDTGTWNQLGNFGPFMQSLSVPKVVIDHHPTQDDLDAKRFVDISAEATGRLVFEAIKALNDPLPAGVASNLFVALAMDTGWFRHSNTTAASLSLAAEFVHAGAGRVAL